MAEIYLPIDWDGINLPAEVMPGDEIFVTGTIMASTQIAFEPEVEDDAFVLTVDTCTDLDSGFELVSAGMTMLAAGNGVFKISNPVRSGGAYFKVYPDTQPTWTVEGVLYSTPAQSAEDIRDAIGLTTANLASLIGDVNSQTTAVAIRNAVGLLIANLDNQLAAIAAMGASPGEGVGDIYYTWTEYELGHAGDVAYAIPDVEIHVYNNETSAGNPHASGTTDELGRVRFYVDEGVYYIFRRKAGRLFQNPIRITVSAATGDEIEPPAAAYLEFSWYEYEDQFEGVVGHEVDGVTVTVFDNIAGTGIPLRSGITVGGLVEFNLLPATYYLFRAMPGRVFANPVEIVVS